MIETTVRCDLCKQAIPKGNKAYPFTAFDDTGEILPEDEIEHGDIHLCQRCKDTIAKAASCLV